VIGVKGDVAIEEFVRPMVRKGVLPINDQLNRRYVVVACRAYEVIETKQ
jgi:hypothetical protein